MKNWKRSTILILFLLIMELLPIFSIDQQVMATEKMETNPPQFLYKILSLDDWKKSQFSDRIILSKADEAFIHLSTDEQLNKIREKYWSNASEFVILKITTDQLPGRLALEANPGGTNKYYHLYDGSIPVEAIVEVKIIQSNKD